jgi:hypothetical protein
MKFIYFLTLLVILSSCRSMGTLYSSIYTEPAVILPEHIKRIGIVNRSLPVDNKGNKTWTTLEAIVSGEGILEDKNGSMAALAGAEAHFRMDSMVQAERLKDLLLPGLGAGRLSPPLEVETISEICHTNNFDALLILESFDTDQKNSQVSNTLNELANAALTGKISVDNLVSTPSYSSVYVKMTWRLYDNHKNMILDEYNFGDYFNSGNYNYDIAEFAKRDAIQSCAYVGGRAYISRFYPSWVKVYRDFFRRGGPDMKMAARMMDVGDFDGAKKVWSDLTKNSKRKIAGRACFNKAVGLELSGNIQDALEWSQKAYSVYRIRQAVNYSNFLMRRLNNPRLR